MSRLNLLSLTFPCIYIVVIFLVNRSIEENLQIASLPKKKKAFNISRKPLFPFIPLAKVVIDNLHLFLRVSDVLVDLLIEELLRQDAIDKSKKDTPRYNHVATFEKFITSIGIPNFNLFLGADSKIKWRSFTGAYIHVCTIQYIRNCI